jgi:hypothetical protein
VIARLDGQGKHERVARWATIGDVLPYSEMALLTVQDDSEEDLALTVELAGAEWEYEDAEAVLPEFADIKWVCFLGATFSNGNRYVFGERAT